MANARPHARQSSFKFPSRAFSNFLPNFDFLLEKVDFRVLKIGKSGFRAKKLSKLGEILSVLDDKKTSKRAAPRGIDWTTLFGDENE